jgi:hypothetical protein
MAASDGRYTRIKSKFWDDEKVIAWDDDTKLLSLYLATCKHNNILGCYTIPLNYICADLRWNDKRLAKPFAKLLLDRFIQYDDNSYLIFVHNYLVHNPLDNVNQVISAQNKLSDLPTSLIMQGLKQFLEWYVIQFDKPIIEPLIQGLHERLNKQYGETYGELYHERYRDTVTFTVTYTEYRNRNHREPLRQSPNESPLFESFWQIYPKKIARLNAQRSWFKQGCDPIADIIMDALEKQARSPDWTKDNGKYIPYPASWLNGKRWEDETDGTDRPTDKPHAPGGEVERLAELRAEQGLGVTTDTECDY